jgi:glycosyltransferase involved in cell wall biosynthesis
VKVALVCDWYHPRVGGIELHLQDLGRQLAAAGHDVVIVTSTPGSATVDGLRVRRVHAPLAPVFGFLVTPAGIRAVGNAIADERVDVAHCHVSIVSPAALGGAAQALHRGVPTAITFHSVVPQMPRLVRAAQAAFGMSTWPASFSAVSERVAHDVRALSGTRPMMVVPNGIDVGFWRTPATATTPAAPRNANEVRIISVMRLNPKKRPFALLDIMQRLVATLPSEPRVSLRIIGDGPQRAALARAIVRAGLADRVELLGRRTRADLRDLLATSDIFLLPTLRESFGLAALEARCVGLPVVAMSASGIAEFIQHGREGLLARSDTELASHVASLVRAPELRCAIARHNRESSPPHDWSRALEANLALYRDAAALRDNV